MSGDRPAADEPLPEDERLSRLLSDYERALDDGQPTESLEQQITREFGSRGQSTLKGLKSLYTNGLHGDGDSTVSSQSDALPHESPNATWTFGRFLVKERVGSGGFGIVFHVFDPKLNRDAALKVPRPDILWQADFERRFLKEAKASAALDHPHILPIYDAGTIDGVHFILSAYCSGPSLAEWLSEQKILQKTVSPHHAALWLMQIAEGVALAHSKGIAHRDLKPANILLDPCPSNSVSPTEEAAYRPRISDFGLCKHDGADASTNASGVIVGTLAYMPPEQAQGTSNADVLAFDIYALGAILFEMLTGRPPLIGQNTFDLIRKIGVEDPPLPRSLRPDVPRDLEAVCLKCLARDPFHRYRSARELCQDLSKFLAGQRVTVPNVSWSSHLWKSVIRRRLSAWTAFGIGGILFITAAVFAWQYLRVLSDNKRLAQTVEDVTEDLAHSIGEQRLEHTVATSEAKKLDDIYESDIQQAYRIWRESRNLERDAPYAAAEMKDLLMRHVPAMGGTDRRGFEWYYLWRCCEPERFVTPARRMCSLPGHMGDVYCVAFSPDGTLLASCGDDKAIRIWNVDTHELVQTLIGHASGVNSFSFSGTGDLLASAGEDQTVRVWNVASGEEVHAFTGHRSEVVSVAFHLHLPLVYSGDNEGIVKVWDVKQKSEVRSFQAHAKRIQSLHRYQQEAAMGLADQQIILTNSDDGTGKTWYLNQLPTKAINPDQTFEFHYGIESFQTAHLQPIFASIGYPGNPSSQISFFRRDYPNRFVVPNRFTVDIGDRVRAGEFTVDDSQYLMVGGNIPIRAVDLATRKSWNLTEPLWIWSLDVSRNGRHIATGGYGGNVMLWDGAVTPHHTMLSQPPSLGDILKFSREGRWLFIGRFGGWTKDPPPPEHGGILWDMTISPPRDCHLQFLSPSNEVCSRVTGCFSPSGRELILAVERPAAQWSCHVFDLESLRETKTFSLPFKDADLTVACDGEHLVCVYGTKTINEFFRFDLKTGTSDDEFSFTTPSNRVVISADGKWLVESDEGIVSMYNIAGRVREKTWSAAIEQARYAHSFVLSSTSDLLAIGDNRGRLKIIDTRDGTIRHTCHGNNGYPIAAASFSADNRRVVAGGPNSAVDMWSTESGRPLHSLPLPVQTKRLLSVCVSPDNKTIAATYSYMPLNPKITLGDLWGKDRFAVILWQITGNEAPLVANP